MAQLPNGRQRPRNIGAAGGLPLFSTLRPELTIELHPSARCPSHARAECRADAQASRVNWLTQRCCTVEFVALSRTSVVVARFRRWATCRQMGSVRVLSGASCEPPARLDPPRSVLPLITQPDEKGGKPMATLVDERALDERLARLEAARPWSPRVVSRLEALIRTDDDAALFRVNPFTFASERDLERTRRSTCSCTPPRSGCSRWTGS